jgi:hypothetical protein
LVEQQGNNLLFTLKNKKIFSRSKMEPNDTILEAIETGLSSDNPGTIIFSESIGDNPNLDPVDPSLDVDFFQVQLEANNQVTIDINASDFGSSLDSILRVFDSAGNEVAVNDDFISLDSFIRPIRKRT